ncbi:hypothetical protein AC249_AIPGENE28774 [Exaiptasia diaphana]|nr:hypothetical protein AC249_AIPGENE28774 [Exaiptasia diaphana]
MCKTCGDYLKSVQELEPVPDVGLHTQEESSHEEESDIDKLAYSFSQIKIQETLPSSENTSDDESPDEPTSSTRRYDETFLSPDTASTASTTSNEDVSNQQGNKIVEFYFGNFQYSPVGKKVDQLGRCS